MSASVKIRGHIATVHGTEWTCTSSLAVELALRSQATVKNATDHGSTTENELARYAAVFFNGEVVSWGDVPNTPGAVY